jgi:hypothetical protein
MHVRMYMLSVEEFMVTGVNLGSGLYVSMHVCMYTQLHARGYPDISPRIPGYRSSDTRISLLGYPDISPRIPGYLSSDTRISFHKKHTFV